MKKFLLILLALIFITSGLQAETDTLRVMSYTVLRYDGGEEDLARLADFQAIIGEVNPDILVCQDVGDSAGAHSILNDILDAEIYGMATFIDVEGQNDNALYFRSEKFTALEPDTLATDLRHITVFPLTYNANEAQPTIYVASAYLKGSDTVEDRQRRLDEVNVLLNYMTGLEMEDPYFLLCGVLNFYDSNEDGYNAIMGEGLFYDPLNAPGEWHDSEEFTALHTQSTRVDPFGGGVGGGCDDRFDFILPLASFGSDSGWTYLADSYTTFGNDGQHLNISINEGENLAVSAEIATSLYNASDHLPVYMDFTYFIEDEDVVSPSDDVSLQEFTFAGAYPNPFNSSVNLSFVLNDNCNSSLAIYDLNGNFIASLVDGYLSAGSYSYNFEANDLPTGLYFARLTHGTQMKTMKMTLLK